jgi:hypothetical protein
MMADLSVWPLFPGGAMALQSHIFRGDSKLEACLTNDTANIKQIEKPSGKRILDWLAGVLL